MQIEKIGVCGSGEWYFYENGILVKRAHNKIVQSGIDLLAALFIAERQNSLPFHLAIGKGNTPAAATDTKLQSEAFRKEVSAKQRLGSTVSIRTQFFPAEANGDFHEFGIFIAGTGEAGSGTLFSRLVTPYSKTSNAVLTIEVKISFAAAS